MFLLNNLKEIIHNLDFRLCFSVASLIISFIATFFSYRNTRIAKQSLKLNENLFEARTPQLAPDLRACFSYRLEKSQSKIYAFLISVSNLSDANNSISRLELQINYTRSNNLSNNLLLPHKPKLVEHLFLNSIKTLNVPIHIRCSPNYRWLDIFRVRRFTYQKRKHWHVQYTIHWFSRKRKQS